MAPVRYPVSAAQILPPRRPWREKAASGPFSDEHLDILSHLLDDFIQIPGTHIRFGLDGIIGFIPGAGDIIAGLASTIIIFAAWTRGVPYIVLARMVLNVLIETVVGAIPFVGNLFDIAWRANRRNYKLLEGSIADPRRHTLTSWLVFGVLAIVLVGIMLLPALLLAYLWTVLHQPPRP